MKLSHLLKSEIVRPRGVSYLPNYYRVKGYADCQGLSDAGARAKAIYSLFTLPEPHIYINDLIAGSIRPMLVSVDKDTAENIKKVMEDYPERYFSTNSDHFTPDYDTAMELGVPGLLEKIGRSKLAHADDPQRVDFLNAMEIAILGLRDRLLKNAEKCRQLIGKDGYDDEKLNFMALNCEMAATRAPASFAEGLQLVWMIHTCFLFEGRFSMATHISLLIL